MTDGEAVGDQRCERLGVEFGDCDRVLGAQPGHHLTASLAERSLERRLAVADFVGRADRGSRTAGAAGTPNTTVSERYTRVAPRSMSARSRSRPWRPRPIATLAVSAARSVRSLAAHSLHDASDVDLDAGTSAPSAWRADCGRGVAPDAGERGEVFRPTVARHDLGGLPQSPGAPRVAEPPPCRDHCADPGGGRRLGGREPADELGPRVEHAADLGLLEHDLAHQHRPAVAGRAPRQIVATVIVVPDGQGGRPRHVVVVVELDVDEVGGAIPTVMVTVEPSFAFDPADGLWLMTLPMLVLVDTAWLTETSNPAEESALTAADCDMPTTSGTETWLGPDDTTMVTGLSLACRRSGARLGADHAAGVDGAARFGGLGDAESGGDQLLGGVDLVESDDVGDRNRRGARGDDEDDGGAGLDLLAGHRVGAQHDVFRHRVALFRARCPPGGRASPAWRSR